MSDNEDNQEKFGPYSNTGNKDDPILRSEYNARKKMCPKCLRAHAAERNTLLREDLASFVTFTACGAYLGPAGAAVGGAVGYATYLFSPVRYTCKFCGASFLVNKWL